MHQRPSSQYLFQLHIRGAHIDGGAVAGGRRMHTCDLCGHGLRPGEGEWPLFFCQPGSCRRCASQQASICV